MAKASGSKEKIDGRLMVIGEDRGRKRNPFQLQGPSF